MPYQVVSTSASRREPLALTLQESLQTALNDVAKKIDGCTRMPMVTQERRLPRPRSGGILEHITLLDPVRR